MRLEVLVVAAFCLVTSSAVRAAEDDISFANGDFEQYANELPAGWTIDPSMQAGRGLGYNGNGGLVWESATPQAERIRSARQKFTGFHPGDLFRFSLLVKKENFSAGKDEGFVAVIEWYDADGKWICAPRASGKPSVPCEWHLVQGGGIVPPRAVSGVFHIYVCRGSSGRISIDNAEVTRVNRDPVQFVCSSAYRDVAVKGSVAFHAVVSVPFSAREPSVFFRWTGASGSAVRKPADFSELPKGEGEASVSIPVSTMAYGSHDVFCELWADGKKLGEALIPFTRVRRLSDRRVWIDEHRRCIVDGEPFFPLGMYWDPGHEESFAQYTNGAFNCVLSYRKLSTAVLDRLDKLGLKVIVGVNDPHLGKEKLQACVEDLKDHPAMLAWYVMDEVGADKIPLYADWYRFLREHDPDHPTYAVQDRIYDLRAFLPAADVFGLDPYPVDYNPVSRVIDFARGGEKALFGARAFWNVPQAFAWKWYRPLAGEKGRFPTYEEFRSMCWQHIAGGANGLVSFCFYRIVQAEKEPDPEVRRENFRRVSAVSAKIARLVPVLLSVEACPKISYPAETLACRAWMKGGCLYLLACNLSNGPISAEVEIASGNWQAAGTEEGSPAAMANGRRVRFDLDRLGVSFVRLEAK